MMPISDDFNDDHHRGRVSSGGRVTAAGCVPAVPGTDLGGRGRRGEEGEGRTGRRSGGRRKYFVTQICHII